MSSERTVRGSLALAALVTASSAAPAADAMQPGLYELTWQTGATQRERGLSDALRQERRCIDPRDPAVLFPILSDTELQGCRLERGAVSGRAVHYLVSCDGDGRHGGARWEAGDGALSGELELGADRRHAAIRQRVRGTRLGDCPDRQD